MASFKEHCRDCERLLGDPCEAVNRWMDEMHSKFGPLHRHVRHHTRGIEEAERKFGLLGKKAAMVHILKDCGRIPKPRDYKHNEANLVLLSLGTTYLGMAGNFNGYWDPFKFDTAARKLLETVR